MPLSTPFEDTGNFSSLATEAAWLDDLAALNRVSVTQVGTSQGGHPLRLVAIGHPAPHPSPKRPLMVIGLQHGDEPGGREASFGFARDLAETTDPATVEYLTDHTVCILPTTNPDGYPDTRRLNDGVNLNRDHLKVATPEARAIADCFRDFVPEIILDHHEQGNTSRNKVETRGATNNAVSQSIRDLTANSLEDYVETEVLAAGFTYGEYVSAGLEAGICRNIAGLRHALGIVIETIWEDPVADRVAQHRAVMDGALAFHIAESATIASTIAASRADKKADGQNRVAFNDGDSLNLDPAPAGYVLTPEQLAAVVDHRDWFAISETSTADGDHFVTMGQESQPVIPYVMDAGAPENMVSATAVSESPDLAPLTGRFVRRGSELVATQDGVIRDGTFVPA